MLPYTDEEADWLAAHPAAPTGATRGTITRAPPAALAVDGGRAQAGRPLGDGNPPRAPRLRVIPIDV